MITDGPPSVSLLNPSLACLHVPRSQLQRCRSSCHVTGSQQNLEESAPYPSRLQHALVGLVKIRHTFRQYSLDHQDKIGKPLLEFVGGSRRSCQITQCLIHFASGPRCPFIAPNECPGQRCTDAKRIREYVNLRTAEQVT